jgi:dienelactone hydrolase
MNKVMILLLVMVTRQVSAQQMSVDARLGNWDAPSFSMPAISSDGRTILYYKTRRDVQRLIIKKNNGQLFADITSASDASFTADGRAVLYQVGYRHYRFDIGKRKIMAVDTPHPVERVVEFPKITLTDTAWQLNDGSEEFSTDNAFISFSAHRRPSNDSALDKCVVWDHKDNMLPPQKNIEKERLAACWFSYHVPTRKITQLTHEGEEKIFSVSLPGYIAMHTFQNASEQHWNISARPSYYLVSLLDGSRKLIADKISLCDLVISPDKKYVVYFNRESGIYYSYHIATGQTTPISMDLPDALRKEPLSSGAFPPFACGIAGWMPGEHCILVYDEYDIYSLDLEGRRPPVNLTSGYGRASGIVLRVAMLENERERSFPAACDMLLSAFDTRNKQNGFFRLSLNRRHPALQKLSMGDYIDQYPYVTDAVMQMPVIKAKNADGYIVQRMSQHSPLRYLYTADFRSFTPLCEDSIADRYILAHAELIRWKGSDGAPLEGILYKPVNFDSTKRYPVIFYFYEDNTNTLNRFIGPGLSDGRLPLLYFVTHGYLVVDPGIKYYLSRPGESALNAVGSAAGYMARLPYVDSTKFGLQGISWGAFQINYILTRSKLFAAAASSAGVSDLTSNYNSLRLGQGVSGQFHAEVSQGRMGGTLWEKKENYIENSPILNADRVKTPLLIEHNDRDEAVPFSQAVEWFIALRRLQKPAWLVEYPGEGHGIYRRENQLDFTDKLITFFDHYLKSQPMPAWMQAPPGSNISLP